MLKKSLFFLKKYKSDYLFMLPYLVIFFTFQVLPVIVSIVLGFTYYNVFEAPDFIGLGNYLKMFLNDDLFMTALANTLVLTIITAPVGYVLSFGVAWMVNEFKPKLRSFLTLLFYIPSLTGGMAAIWMIVFNGDQYGVLNGALMSLNVIFEPIQWLTDTDYMMPAAIVIAIWMSLGTSFLAFVAGFRTVDEKLYEAAAIDGIRNRFQELWFITLPSMKPQLMFGAVMSITSTFSVSAIINQIFGFPSTGYRLYTLVHMLEDYGGQRLEMGYASAVATILFIIMIGLNKAVQNLIAKVGN
jgi:multiple sugar transport system permease protein